LRVLPVDINLSRAKCGIEMWGGPPGPRPTSTSALKQDQEVLRGAGTPPYLRLGFKYVRGLRARAAEAIEAAQPFTDIEDLARRVPELEKSELTQLAAIGALNSIGAGHRRDALWQATRAGRPVGQLLREVPETAPESPLLPMTIEERLLADCEGTGMTIGRHPMAYHRAEMNRLGVVIAAVLHSIPNGKFVKVAGNVIVRQRPGTAKGILFMSLEDETGISNVVVMPDVFDRQRLDILNNAWVIVEGQMQNVDNVIHILAQRIAPIPRAMEIGKISHDFH
jgi:error-prone DNA polymerase